MAEIKNDIQLGADGRLRHLLGLKGLDKNHLLRIIDAADDLIGADGQLRKSKALDDMSIANLFFEPSTRTRNTFEIAAKRSSAKVINVDLENSATKKNETVVDTIRTLEAMQIDMLVIRHRQNGLPHALAENLRHTAIINAGDGTNAHPTQALLDIQTIRQYKKDFAGLAVAMIGDIVHSRVAHSDIHALKTLGVRDIRLIAPAPLQYHPADDSGIYHTENMDEGVAGTDVIIALRLQKERMLAADIPNEREYFKHYGLDEVRLNRAKKDAIVMHPGPINRGVEIDSKIADGPRSAILRQVKNGIAVRMAVMAILAGRA